MCKRVFPSAFCFAAFVLASAGAAETDYERMYKGPHPLKPSNRPVAADTPLVPGQIVAGQDAGGWFPCDVLELLPDGKVKVHYRGWSSNWDKVLTRDKLQLAHEGLVQPGATSSPRPAPAQVPAPTSTGPATQSGEKPAESEFVGFWRQDSERWGLVEIVTIAKANESWKVSGVYFRNAVVAGGFEGKNVTLQDGALHFEKELTRSPIPGWARVSKIAARPVRGELHWAWSNEHGSKTAIYIRTNSATPAAAAPSPSVVIAGGTPRPPTSVRPGLGPPTPPRPSSAGPSLVVPSPKPPTPLLASGGEAGRSSARDLPGFPGWLQSLDAAKKTAAEKNLDVLLVFTSSDKSSSAGKMARNIFSRPDFLENARRRFVPVVIDVPPSNAKADMEQRQNREWIERYGVEVTPTVLLLDSAGTPYLAHGFLDTNADNYGKILNKVATNRSRRDELMTQAKTAGDPAQRLEAAEKMVEFVRKQSLPRQPLDEDSDPEDFLFGIRSLGLLKFYSDPLQEWIRIAREQDGQNSLGKLELFFEADWQLKLSNAVGDDERAKVVKKLDAWDSRFTFRDQDRGALLHLQASMVMQKSGQNVDALRLLELAVKYKPESPILSAFLEPIAKAIQSLEQFSSGTGFIVHRQGYVLTNHHVIDGPGRLVVRRPDTNEEIPAEVIAKDEQRDMALLKVAPEKFKSFQPIPVTAAPVGRGARVAMFGYPLGDAFGKGLKFSQGGISGLPDESNEFMLLIDGRVNPGNSGGPLCNVKGHVVGMVTAKSDSGEGVDSYGMAIPSSTLHQFLKAHLPGYSPPSATSAARNLEWDVVDGMVNQSVLMILKVRS